MNNEKNDYRGYLLNTLVQPSYLNKTQTEKVLEIIKKEGNVKGEGSLFNLVKECKGRELKEVCLNIEKYEFEKPYRYTYLYEANNLEGTIQSILEKEFEDILIYEENKTDHISRKAEIPKVLIEKDYIYLKFSFLIPNLQERNKIIKYPILACISRKKNLVQIKFGSVSLPYMTETFYYDYPKKVKHWLENTFSLNMREFDSFSAIENIMKKKKELPLEYEDVIEHSKAANDMYDGKTRVRIDKENRMPFFYGLKELREKLVSEEDKVLLDEFLEEIEESYDYSARGLKFFWSIGPVRKSSIVVYFRKEYLGTQNTLVHFKYNNHRKEKHNDVIEYLERHKRVSRRKSRRRISK